MGEPRVMTPEWKRTLTHPLGVISLYLIAVLPPLALGPWNLAHTALAAAHLAVLAACLHTARRPGESGWIGLWAAFVLMPLLYTEVAQLNQLLGAGYHDPLIAGWEAAIFGSPATDLAAAWPALGLSESLHFAYFLFYPTIYVPPLLLFLHRRREEFQTTALAVLAAATVCFVVFVYFPVQGPRYFGPPEGVPAGPIRGLTLRILESGSSRGAAFPSSHMAITVAQAVAQLRFQRGVGVAVAIIATGVGFGAVYGGFHYGIDMVVGGGIGLVAGWAALRIRG